MHTRQFGTRSGFTIPPVSIGSMRLPPDLDQAVELVRHAIDAGMRYIDTSRGYGESEWLLGKALKDGYREKVILSTKWSPWIKPLRPDDAPTASCVRHRLEESMKRLDVDYLDYYQIWNIDSKEHYHQAIKKGGMLEGILQAKDEGLIGHTGFTTHDSVDHVLEYIEEAHWCEIILFTYNMRNQTYAPAIQAAHEKGIGTLVMNPVGGGKLAQPSEVFAPLCNEVEAVSLPDCAIRYVLSNPYVDTILCGIQKKEDIAHTIASAQRPRFDEHTRGRIEAFVQQRTPENTRFCTACGYCTPCPQGIDIPRIMQCVHEAKIMGFIQSARDAYRRIKGPKAAACSACGQCEDVCTQQMPIREYMRYAHSRLAAE